MAATSSSAATSSCSAQATRTRPAQALAAFPEGLQVGGGIRPDNAAAWLSRGAAQVIVTSYVFSDGQLHRSRLAQMVAAVGRERLVLDLSCSKRDGRYVVMTDRWQKATDFAISADNLALLAESCSEFLIHATGVEGKQQGVDAELVALLGEIAPLPTTYAGGVCSTADIEILRRLGQGKLDFTVGAALDIFGGQGCATRICWHTEGRARPRTTVPTCRA